MVAVVAAAESAARCDDKRAEAPEVVCVAVVVCGEVPMPLMILVLFDFGAK